MDAVTLAYDVVIHHDFGTNGGRRDWSGKFDGVDLLYFQESMVVGPGTWSAGWYQASPLLAVALQRVISGATLPNVGSGDARDDADWRPIAWLAGLAALALGLGGVFAIASSIAPRRSGALDDGRATSTAPVIGDAELRS